MNSSGKDAGHLHRPWAASSSQGGRSSSAGAGAACHRTRLEPRTVGVSGFAGRAALRLGAGQSRQASPAAGPGWRRCSHCVPARVPGPGPAVGAETAMAFGLGSFDTRSGGNAGRDCHGCHGRRRTQQGRAGSSRHCGRPGTLCPLAAAAPFGRKASMRSKHHQQARVLVRRQTPAPGAAVQGHAVHQLDLVRSASQPASRQRLGAVRIGLLQGRVHSVRPGPPPSAAARLARSSSVPPADRPRLRKPIGLRHDRLGTAAGDQGLDDGNHMAAIHRTQHLAHARFLPGWPAPKAIA